MFAANDIDLGVVPLLTDADLEKLGLSLGHRKRVLHAAAALAVGGWLAAQRDATSSERSIHPGPERRQLTVMFCDLSGSTEMSTRLDPEDLREILNEYRRRCTSVIQRFDGHVAQYLGDGVLVYFGYPQASEDAADRAVFAGLEIVKATSSEFAVGPARIAKLGVRIGIATGDVVVGDQIGTGAVPESGVVGETPNLAARLQGLAEPGQVIVSDQTRRLTRRHVGWIGPRIATLKGFREPVHAWLAGTGPAASSGAVPSGGIDQFRIIGRQTELALLTDRLESARAGEGQVALLIGEAGIGKTTITRALMELAGDANCIRYQFSPFHQNTELWPFAAEVERQSAIVRSDPPAANLRRLEVWLREHDDNPAVNVALFAALMALPLPAGGELSDLTPGAIREKTLLALEANIIGATREDAVLLVFEDVHWMDPTSAELFKRLVDRVSGRRFLLLANARPEFDASWSRLAHVTALTLGRMPKRDATELIKHVAGTREIDSDVIEQLLARAQGNPLFAEELTKSVLEGYPSGERATRTSQAIPASLRDLLLERLDRLGPAKETAQAAAVIGQEFDERLLGVILDRTSSERQRDLDRLVQSQIVVRNAGEGQPVYAFRHALIQDTAYQSLLKVRRRAYHLHLAEALEGEIAPEIRDREPERMARHYAEAGVYDRAITWWQTSGVRASQRSASLEAVEQLTMALNLVREHLPEQDRPAMELPLLTALGPALMATRGWNTPEVRIVYSEALELGRATGRSAELFPAVWGRWLTAHAGGEAQIARELLRQLFDLIASRTEPDLLVQAHHAGCSTMGADGEFAESLKHMEAALAIYDLDAHRRLAMSYGGHDPCVCMQCTGALVEMIQGHTARSHRLSQEARLLASRVGHVPTTAHAQWYAAELCQILNEPARATEFADKVLVFAAEKGLAQYAAWAKMIRGWALASAGRFDQGLAETEEGLTTLRPTGVLYHIPHRLGMRAQTYALAGRPQQALDAIEEALASVEQTDERWYESELLRIKAEMLAKAPIENFRSAEACLEQAIATAAGRGALLWEARARIDLARLLASAPAGGRRVQRDRAPAGVAHRHRFAGARPCGSTPRAARSRRVRPGSR